MFLKYKKIRLTIKIFNLIMKMFKRLKMIKNHFKIILNNNQQMI